MGTSPNGCDSRAPLWQDGRHLEVVGQEIKTVASVLAWGDFAAPAADV
jgi:hypothetical protein